MIAIYGSTWSHFKQTTFYNTTLDSFLQSYNVYKIGQESNISLGPFFQYCTIANYIILKTILIYDFREFIRLAIHWGCLIYFSDVVIMN